MPIKMIIIILKEQELLIMSLAFSCVKQFFHFPYTMPIFYMK